MMQIAYERVAEQGLLFDVRKGTSDQSTIREAIINNVYRQHGVTISPGERWLDLGGNIGAFACLAGQAGAIVESYEAEPNNVALARHNAALNGLADAVVVAHAAVVHDAYTEKWVNLGLSGSRFSQWSHSLYKKSGKQISVPAVRFSTLITPQVTGIKMDIEGAEVEILSGDYQLQNVRKFCVEYHFGVTGAIPLYAPLVKKLRAQFSTVVAWDLPVTGGPTIPRPKVIYCLR